ncbi:MAG: CotH kinase family protein, partial [Gemmataceae bacterium]|nr:CotH kinase family protein [Gemmataceae bacterium]
MHKPHLLLPALLGLLLAGAATDSQSEAVAQQPAPTTQDEFFGTTRVWTFHLKLTAEAWQKMQPTRTPNLGMFPGGKPQPPGGKPQPPGGKPFPPFGKPMPPAKADKDTNISAFGFDFTWVQGTLEFGDKEYKDVGVRFKGNSTYMFSAQGIKRPLKIDFNRFVKGQKLHGLTMVALGNNAFDPSQLREALSYEVYRAAGVPAPRTAFVKLYLT